MKIWLVMIEVIDDGGIMSQSTFDPPGHLSKPSIEMEVDAALEHIERGLTTRIIETKEISK